MLRALALLLLIAALSLVACGGDEGAGTTKDAAGVRQTMRTMLDAFKHDDYAAVCDVMTQEARDEVTENTDGDCEGTMALAGGLLPDDELDDLLEKADRAKVTIDGDRATVAGDDAVYVWRDGAWLVGPDGDTTEEAPAEDTDAEPEAPEAEPASVTVTEQGFQQSGEALFWGGVVENATDASDAEGVTVNVNALDRKGDVIASQEVTVGYVPGGAEMNVGSEIPLEEGGEVDDVETEVAVADQSPASGTGLPAVKNARYAADDFGFSIRAQLTNDTGSPLSLLTSAFAVMRDGKGDIVGGTSAVPLSSDLPAGRRRSIELTGLYEVAGVERVDVSVAPEWDE